METNEKYDRPETRKNNLLFDKHVIGVCKRAGRKLSALKRLARILPFHKRRIIIQ